MKKIVFMLTLVAAICVSVMTISARDKEKGNGKEKETRFTFQTMFFPGDTFTQLLGINDFDVIAGYHGANVNKGFVFTFPNTFTPENFPNSAQTQVIGINNRGFADGFYIDMAGTTHGFLDINGAFTTVDFPGTTFNQLLGLNNFDQAAGYFADAANVDHPYIFDSNGGVFLVITIPAATGGAQGAGIKGPGAVLGFFIYMAGKNHGFCLSKGKFQTSHFPRPPPTPAFSLNQV